MIKLIMCDMDGTLLNDKKELPKNINRTIDALEEKNIVFGIATGRALSSLFRDFSDRKQNMAFIAENGAVVYYKGALLYKEVMNPELVTKVIEDALKIRNVHIILASLDKTYMLKSSKEEILYFDHFYPNIVIVDSLFGVKDEIVKVSIYDRMNSEQNSYPSLIHFQSELSVSTSGKEWTDVSVMGVNKGKGIEICTKLLNISRENCMAFGDYMNDYEMLKYVKHSYAMANAHPKIKEISFGICKSNNENGVIDKINEVLFIDTL